MKFRTLIFLSFLASWTFAQSDIVGLTFSRIGVEKPSPWKKFRSAVEYRFITDSTCIHIRHAELQQGQIIDTVNYSIIRDTVFFDPNSGHFDLKIIRNKNHSITKLTKGHKEPKKIGSDTVWITTGSPHITSPI